MTCNNPRKLEIERLIANDLEISQAKELSEHIEQCQECSSYAQNLQKQAREFSNEYSYEEFAKKNILVKESSFLIKIFETIFTPVMTPIYAALLLAAVIIPFTIKELEWNGNQAIAFKGKSQISYILNRDGVVEAGTPGKLYQAGDRIQVLYSSNKKQFMALLSVDKNHTISFYHPDQSSEYCSVPVEIGSSRAFPGSILLDEAKGYEIVVALFSNKPLQTSLVQDWMNSCKGLGKVCIERKVRDKLPDGVSSGSIIVLQKE